MPGELIDSCGVGHPMVRELVEAGPLVGEFVVEGVEVMEQVGAVRFRALQRAGRVVALRFSGTVPCPVRGCVSSTGAWEVGRLHSVVDIV